MTYILQDAQIMQTWSIPNAAMFVCDQVVMYFDVKRTLKPTIIFYNSWGERKTNKENKTKKTEYKQ